MSAPASTLNPTLPILREGGTWNYQPASITTALQTRLEGSAGNGGPLGALFDGFGTQASHDAQGVLYGALSTGTNPRQVASQLADALDTSRTRALVISRNELVDAYRNTQLENYRANSDIVQSWLWSAAPGCCAACMFMDGSVHDLDEDLDDHVGGRCMALPVTRGWDDILGPLGIDASDIPDTAIDIGYEPLMDWFEQAGAVEQEAILGPAKYEAWARGDLQISDLVGVRDDGAWGNPIYEKSLRELGLDAGDYLGRNATGAVREVEEVTGEPSVVTRTGTYPDGRTWRVRDYTGKVPPPSDETNAYASLGRTDGARWKPDWLYRADSNDWQDVAERWAGPEGDFPNQQCLRCDRIFDGPLDGEYPDHLVGGSHGYCPECEADQRAAWLRETFTRLNPDATADEIEAMVQERIAATEVTERLGVSTEQAEQGQRVAGNILVQREGDVDAASMQLYGRVLTDEEHAQVVGALDDSFVQVKGWSNGYLEYQVVGPGYQLEPDGSIYLQSEQNAINAEYRASRTVYRDDDGHLIISNMLSDTRDDLQGRGIAARLLKGEIEGAYRVGVERIELFASGDGGTVWPRLGFDGKIPTELRAQLPEEFKSVRTVQQLLKSPEGRAWWNANNEGVDLSFKISPRSVNVRVFNAYLREKGLEPLDLTLNAIKENIAGEAKAAEGAADALADVRPRSDFVETVHANQSEAVRQLAEAHNMTVAEYKTAVEEHLADILDNAQVNIRRSEDALSDLLENGRLRNFTDKPGYSPGIGRGHWEEKAFGPNQHPVYGYLTNRGTDLAAAPEFGYGNVRMVLKDDIRDRMTFAGTDSAGSEHLVPRPIEAPRYDAMYLDETYPSPSRRGLAGIDPLNYQSVNDVGERVYFEAQIHGGITPADIREVIFDERPSQELLDALDRQGIKWSIEGEPAQAARDTSQTSRVIERLSDPETQFPAHVQTAEQADAWLSGQFPGTEFNFAAIDPFAEQTQRLIAENPEAWATEHVPPPVMQQSIAREVAGAFTDIAQQYPEVAQRLEYVGLLDDAHVPMIREMGMSGGGMVEAQEDGRALLFGRQWRDDAGLAKAFGQNVGYTLEGGNTPLAVMRHEFGHLVESYIQTLPEEQRGAYEAWVSTHPFEGTLVSQYARKSAAEHFAEAFDALYDGTAAVRNLPEVQELAGVLRGIFPDVEIPQATKIAEETTTIVLNSSARDTVEKLIGQQLTSDDLAGLVGAQPGDTVALQSAGDEVKLTLQGPRMAEDSVTPEYTATRTLHRDADGRLIMSNDGLEIPKEAQGKGIGTRLFADEVRTLSRLGVDAIETDAGGSGAGVVGFESYYNGYYTWARLGYDAPIPQDVLAKLPDDFKGATRISDLMRTPAGQTWWKANGEEFRGVFDLTPGSRSMRTLDNYLREKGLEPLDLRAAERMVPREPVSLLDTSVTARDEERFARLPGGGEQIPAPAPGYEDSVHEYQLPMVRDLAKAHGMSVDEFDSAATEHLQQLISNADVNIRLNDARLVRLLDQGEIVLSGGLDFSEAIVRERPLVEGQMFGIGLDAPASERPVYGYISDAGTDAENVRHYGAARIVLKDDISARTTVTFSDSLLYSGGIVPSPMDAVQSDAWRYIPKLSLDNATWLQKSDPLALRSLNEYSQKAGSYIEAQIHGGVSLGDIREVVFDAGSKPSQEIIDALDRQGIKWRMEGQEASGERFSALSDALDAKTRGAVGDETASDWADALGEHGQLQGPIAERSEVLAWEPKAASSDVSDVLSDQLDVHVNFDELHPAAANQFAQTLQVLRADFPEVFGETLDYIGQTGRDFREYNPESTLGRSRSALASSNGPTIGFNRYFWSTEKTDLEDLTALLHDQVNDRWFFDGAGSPASQLAHEFGHSLYWWAVGNDDPAITRLVMDYMARWSGEVPVFSRYAASDPHELFAEAFAAQYFGSSDVLADPMVQDMAQLLRDIRDTLGEGGEQA